MKETQKHIDAYNEYFLLKQKGMTSGEAIKTLIVSFGVTKKTLYRWKEAFDWDGREAIQNHDVQTKVVEKTNEALSDNKAWYLRILHEKIREAENMDSIHVESMADFERAAKLALLIQGDDKHDTTETNTILRDILSALTERPEGVNRIGVKSSFDDKG